MRRREKRGVAGPAALLSFPLRQDRTAEMGNFCFSGFILFPKPLSLRCHDPSLRTADSSGDELEIDASDDPISGTEVRSHLSGRSNHSSWQALCVNDLDLQPATWDVRLRTAARNRSLSCTQNMPPLPISRHGSRQPKDKASHRARTHGSCLSASNCKSLLFISSPL